MAGGAWLEGLGWSWTGLAGAKGAWLEGLGWRCLAWLEGGGAWLELEGLGWRVLVEGLGWRGLAEGAWLGWIWLEGLGLGWRGLAGGAGWRGWRGLGWRGLAGGAWLERRGFGRRGCWFWLVWAQTRKHPDLKQVFSTTSAAVAGWPPSTYSKTVTVGLLGTVGESMVNYPKEPNVKATAFLKYARHCLFLNLVCRVFADAWFNLKVLCREPSDSLPVGFRV